MRVISRDFKNAETRMEAMHLDKQDANNSIEDQKLKKQLNIMNI